MFFSINNAIKHGDNKVRDDLTPKLHALKLQREKNISDTDLYIMRCVNSCR